MISYMEGDNWRRSLSGGARLLGVTAEADAGFDLGGGDGVRIYREPGDANSFEAERHAGSRQGIWI